MKNIIFSVCAFPMLTISQAMPIEDQGNWTTSLKARDLDGIISNGPEAYFDSKLNITWLKETSVKFGTSLGNDRGLVGYNQAVTWVENLDYRGVNDWRLPNTKPVNGMEFVGNFAYNGTADLGYWNTSSEMSHLFYVALGNTGYCPGLNFSNCTTLPAVNPQVGLSNSGPFQEFLTTGTYVSATPFYIFPEMNVWIFDFSTGLQDYCVECGPASAFANAAFFNALAVHDGDVGTPIPTIPEPSVWAMILCGLATMAASRWKHKQRDVDA